MRLDLVDGGLGRCLPPRPDLPLLGEDGDGLAAGWASECVGGLWLRRGSRLTGCLVCGSSGSGSPLRGSFSKRCVRLTAFFSLASRTEDSSSSLCFGFVVLRCQSRVLVVRVVPLDRLFIPPSGFLGLESNTGVEVDMAGRSVEATRIV